MRYRPKRENYPMGTYGDIDYQERLERYCTYLENRNKALTEQCNIADVSISLERAKKYARYQHFLGSQGSGLVEFEDWAQD